MKYIKIPLDRVAVLIGKNGEIKKYLESKTGIRLDINSKEGDVKIFNNEKKKSIFIILFYFILFYFNLFYFILIYFNLLIIIDIIINMY